MFVHARFSNEVLEKKTKFENASVRLLVTIGNSFCENYGFDDNMMNDTRNVI